MAKLHSLGESRWTRFRAFLRGLLLYNTVYWRRASDEVNRQASRLSPSERARNRPQVDPELLRPRANAARQDLLAGATLPPPPIPANGPRLVLPAVDEALLGARVEPGDPVDPGVHLPGLPPAAEPPEAHRRRVFRRRHPKNVPTGVNPAEIFSRAAAPRPSWLRRLFGGN